MPISVQQGGVWFFSRSHALAYKLVQIDKKLKKQSGAFRVRIPDRKKKKKF